MIDRDENRQQLYRERFKPFCEKWYGLLQLSNWEISYELTGVIDDDPTIEAQCNVNAQLGHRATILIAERMAYEDDRTREELIIHELTHIILDELGQFAFHHLPDEHHPYFTRLMEIATSDLTRILVVSGENLGHPGQ